MSGLTLEGDDVLAHYGILRKSGRYPWGSGKDQDTRNKMFLDHVSDLRKQGLSEVDIARGFGITTTELRAAKSIAKTAHRQAQIGMAQRLKDKGYSNTAIGQRMGINESSVRSLLVPGIKDRTDILETTAAMLKDQVAKKDYIDIGKGVEQHIGISATKLKTAVAMLKEEGYKVHYVQVQQLGTGKFTTVTVLSKPDVSYSEVYKNQDKIRQITDYSDDGGRSYSSFRPPLSISSKRVAINYAEDGGADADGVIYVRRGVKDVSLGGNNYAQVRIAVDGTHYLKGMAVYKDDLPDGVDLVFNTNKKNTGDKRDAMKKLNDDPDSPFGSIPKRQILDARGEKPTSVMNILNEEGDWGDWSKSLATQMLSKQPTSLTASQLKLTRERKKDEFDEIMALTNPAVKKKLLDSFADDVDASAVHLKAAALPRQASHVILPVNSLKDNEVYAPNYRNGESVVLIRYPHGGVFEIPELRVNNNHPEAKRLLGNAPDAIGINSKVAQRLSGADFDGDTVLVIPNNQGKIKTAPALAGLKGFDPQSAYPAYEGMKRMTPKTKALQMGDVSNLITDMTIKGASPAELARAVRHSMVVIDAEKHKLNYKQSAIDNGIAQLKEKYQGKKNAGSSTLISRATSPIQVPNRRPRPAAEGGPVDRATGEKVYVPTGESYVDRRTGKTVIKKFTSDKLAEAKDAHSLSSGTPVEKLYADHSNSLKSLANEARRQSINTRPTPYSPSAKAAYSKEVATLDAKLSLALRNAPLERQAQLLANAIVTAKKAARPDLEPSELKKIKAQALAEARARTGAKKQRIDITDQEWAAIQAGAISTNKLSQILDNSDLDVVKTLATPRKAEIKMTSTKTSRAKAMAASGYTQAEIAEALGVSLTTLKTALKEG